MTEPARRLPSSKRKEQIIDATIKLIMEKGLAWATMSRIANEVGITEPALYRHFKNRREIILATLKTVSIQLIATITIKGDDIVSDLRSMAQALYDIIMQHPEQAKVLFEFICAAPEEDLRGNMQDFFEEIIHYLESIIEKGINEGSIKADIDVSLTAWEIFALGFTMHYASLIGLNSFLDKDRAMSALETIIQGIIA